jgi:electron transfer flavoprotein alpha subunit
VIESIELSADAVVLSEELVVELRETFERIQELREKWSDAGGASRVIVPAAWESLERVVGPCRDVAELITKVRDLKPGP